MAEPILRGYWRSSAAYRVRIALNLKRIEVRHMPVNLRRGEQSAADHLASNPAGLVPVYEEGEFRLSQSLAIIDYLDETYPEPPFLPGDARRRAEIRAVALDIAADIHPIGNLRVLDRLTELHKADREARAAWNRHWIARGFAAIETRLQRSAGRFSFGSQPTLADICLVPQVYNARRFGLDLSAFPTIVAVDAAAAALPAFVAAEPERQPDAELEVP
jgi:maleylpyruvate isomerase